MSFKWPATRGKVKRNSGTSFGQYRPEKKEESSLPSPIPEIITASIAPPPNNPVVYTPVGQASLYHDLSRKPPATPSLVDGSSGPGQPPTPPPKRISPPLASLPPRTGTQAVTGFVTEATSPAQYMAASLEFIGSKPPVEGRDPSGRGKENPKAWRIPKSSSQKDEGTTLEHRLSDSQGKTAIPSSSPSASGQPTQMAAIDLPFRASSSDSRNGQQAQSDRGQKEKETASILDELMKRYERREAEMRKAHETELRRMQKDHILSLDKLKQELMETKESHAKEVQKLKEHLQETEKNWKGSYDMMMQYRETAERSQTALKETKADHAAELELERQEKERLVGELNKKYEMLDKKTHSHIDVLEREAKTLTYTHENKMKDIKERFEQKLHEQAARHHEMVNGMQKDNEEQAVGMKKQIAELSTHLAARTEEKNKAKAHEANLQKDVEVLKSECKSLQARHADQREAYGKREKSMAEEMERMREYYEKRLKITEAKGDDQRTKLEERLQQQRTALVHEMETREAGFQDQMERMRADHAKTLSRTTLDLEQRIRSLKSDLVDNGDEMRPSLGGGALQTRYRELKLKVERITEPFNLAEIASPRGFNTAELDQGEFLVKEGKSQMRFLLRSICWSIIMDGFFSAPFGFGAFGRSQGKKMLLDVYATWQRLFDPGFTGFIAAPELSDQEDFEPFYNDKSANWWRSATFQSIQSVIFPSRRMSLAQTGKPAESLEETCRSPGPQGIVKAFRDNVETTKKSILGLIAQVCSVDRVNEAIEREVQDMVTCASSLAMDFGAHGAKICFGMPKVGDTVQIGAEFVDCADGDSNRGNLETVELAVAPSLFMIGDGRRDLTSPTCLHPGEIYPRRATGD